MLLFFDKYILRTNLFHIERTTFFSYFQKKFHTQKTYINTIFVIQITIIYEHECKDKTIKVHVKAKNLMYHLPAEESEPMESFTIQDLFSSKLRVDLNLNNLK